VVVPMERRMMRAMWRGRRSIESASDGVEEARTAMIMTEEISEKNWRGER
jgi:hypothetical protein